MGNSWPSGRQIGLGGLGASTQDYLNIISQYESNNRNIPNYNYGQLTPSGQLQTAQGYYQITDTNWSNIAPLLGIDTVQYPNAMSAPQSVQAQVATYLLTQTTAGISNWTNYNSNLFNALASAGLQTSGAVVDTSNLNTYPVPGSIIDVSGSDAALPTSDLLSGVGADLSQVLGTDPTTSLVLLAVVGAAAVAWVAMS